MVITLKCFSFSILFKKKDSFEIEILPKRLFLQYFQMDAWEIAKQNFMNIPYAVAADWPFILGFGIIEAGTGWVKSMLPVPESMMGAVVQKSLEEGTSTLIKFVYWDGLSKTQ